MPETPRPEALLVPLADGLVPEFVRPIVACLAHEGCPVSGEIYSVGGGNVARVFIGVTPGYTNKEMTVESIRDNFETIRAEEGYAVPGNLNEEMMLTLKALS